MFAKITCLLQRFVIKFLSVIRLQKIVFELRIHGELSFEKIGRIFGKSSGWARVTYYRAKMKILEYMEAENNE